MDLLHNLIDPAPGPDQEAEAAEEYLMRQQVAPGTGKPLIALPTGEPVLAKVMLWGQPIAVEKPNQRKVSHRGQPKGKGKTSKANEEGKGALTHGSADEVHPRGCIPNPRRHRQRLRPGGRGERSRDRAADAGNLARERPCGRPDIRRVRRAG
jgi:hypothetical protein